MHDQESVSITRIPQYIAAKHCMWMHKSAISCIRGTNRNISQNTFLLNWKSSQIIKTSITLLYLLTRPPKQQLKACSMLYNGSQPSQKDGKDNYYLEQDHP